MSEKVTKRRLEWLGHLARMPDNRTPKVSLFSWLPEPRPQGGPPKRWRDVIRSDLKDMQIPEDTWYAKATTSREEWRNTTERLAQTSPIENNTEDKLIIGYNARNAPGPFAEKVT